MENHLIRGGMVNEDIPVVIDAARRSQFDVNMGVLVSEISELGLMKAVVHIVAENGDLHPGGHRFQQDQCLQTDIVVNDMNCFLSVGIYFGIGDVGLNGLTVIEKVVFFDVFVSKVVNHDSQVVHLLFDLADFLGVVPGLSGECQKFRSR